MKKILFLLSVIAIISSCGGITPFVFNSDVPEVEQLANVSEGYTVPGAGELTDNQLDDLFIASLTPTYLLAIDSMEKAFDVPDSRNISGTTKFEITIKDEKIAVDGKDENGYLKINGFNFLFSMTGAIDTVDWTTVKVLADGSFEFILQADIEYDNYKVSEGNMNPLISSGSKIQDGVIKLDFAVKLSVIKGSFDVKTFLNMIMATSFDIENLNTEFKKFLGAETVVKIDTAKFSVNSAATLEIVDVENGNYGCKIALNCALKEISDKVLDYGELAEDVYNFLEDGDSINVLDTIVGKYLYGDENAKWLTLSIVAYDNSNVKIDSLDRKNTEILDFVMDLFK